MKRLIIALMIISLIPSGAFCATKSCYKLNNDYVAVKTRVFNDLVKSQKLIEIYENQIELLESNMNDLEKLDTQKTEAYDKKIASMQLTIDTKQAIIDTQNDTINQYKNLQVIANANSKKIDKMSRLNIWQKIFVSGILGYAISEVDSNGAKVALGALGVTNIAISW